MGMLVVVLADAEDVAPGPGQGCLEGDLGEGDGGAGRGQSGPGRQALDQGQSAAALLLGAELEGFEGLAVAGQPADGATVLVAVGGDPHQSSRMSQCCTIDPYGIYILAAPRMLVNARGGRQLLPMVQEWCW